MYLTDGTAVWIFGNRYEHYLDSLSGLGEEVQRATSEGLNTDITLRLANRQWRTEGEPLIAIGDTYPFEGASVVIKEVYFDRCG
jgi:hypothetical protein